MCTVRVLLVGLVCFGTLGTAMPSSADAPPPSMRLSSSSVAPGGSVTVSGTCPGFDMATITLLDRNGDLDLATAAAPTDENGVWSAPIRVDPGTPPDTYPVTVACDGYSAQHYSFRAAMLQVLPPPPPTVRTLLPPLPEG